MSLETGITRSANDGSCSNESISFERVDRSFNGILHWYNRRTLIDLFCLGPGPIDFLLEA